MFNKLSFIVLVSFSLCINNTFAKEHDKNIKTEIVLDATTQLGNICYYENFAYSRGAVISKMLNNKAVQLKCDVLNEIVLNGAVGWVDLLAPNQSKQTNKLTFDRQ